MKKKRLKIEKKIKTILKKFFKQNNKFYSMENTPNWDSLNHLKLIDVIQQEFKINISNLDIAKMTDQKKIIILLLKKIK